MVTGERSGNMRKGSSDVLVGICLYMSLMAAAGSKGWSGMEGIGISCDIVTSCIVFDQRNVMTAPGSWNVTLPLHVCLVGLKVVDEFGARLERRRKAKKASRYAAWSTRPTRGI